MKWWIYQWHFLFRNLSWTSLTQNKESVSFFFCNQTQSRKLQSDVEIFLNLNSFKLFSGLLAWSKDSQYICTRNDSMPTALWIWDMQRLEVAAILVQKEPIRAAVWDPTCTRLLLCTGSSHLYMWTPSGAFCVCSPLPGFSITDLKWNIDGSCLLLKDKDAFCCATVPPLPESSDYSSDDWGFDSLCISL